MSTYANSKIEIHPIVCRIQKRMLNNMKIFIGKNSAAVSESDLVFVISFFSYCYTVSIFNFVKKQQHFAENPKRAHRPNYFVLQIYTSTWKKMLWEFTILLYTCIECILNVHLYCARHLCYNGNLVPNYMTMRLSLGSL